MVFLVSCSTLSVNVDYDEGYDFSRVKSFSIKHYAKEGESELVNKRITDALRKTLEFRGYKYVQKGADMVFVYHYGAKDKVNITTDYQMIGYRGFGYGGAMIATPRTYNYTEGTIVVDGLDPKTKKIVYRTVGTLELQEQKTPQEKRKYTNKIIQELMQKFPPEK
ncbi:DUF4136 domain-containing protein [Sulfurimonas paralvinellae]|uniref:DUF4136 domain-containing protein n=1 Tax=Sulfurimonas paralvinellae TaxID=317658 RepID=UPI001D0589D1|nr:DUF4136 domain-containing protein [Sulfurimonas paralvinellae]